MNGWRRGFFYSMTELQDIAMTHGEKFHADDVFSSALLRMINPDIKIMRVFDVPEGFGGLVFDIGYGRYDHHQQDAEKRENGIPYASFGLLWREFGADVIGDGAGFTPEQAAKEAAHFDETFIQPLDADDNTGCGNQLAGVINTFNPSWDSAEPADRCFEEAVNFALVILKRKMESVRSVQRARRMVEDALSNSRDHIVVLSRYAPWKPVLIMSDAEFVVYPSQRGGYSAQVIPTDFDGKNIKCNFPEEWAGKTKEELRSLSGIGTLTFCHKGRFLISAERFDDIISACRYAQEKEKKDHG